MLLTQNFQQRNPFHPHTPQQQQDQEHKHDQLIPQPLSQDSLYPLHTSPYFSGSDVDLDADALSISSSPVSSESFLPQYPSLQGPVLTAYDTVATIAGLRGTQRESVLADLAESSYAAASFNGVDEPSFFEANDQMHTDSWFPSAQMTSKSAARPSHNRDSSLSSLGSAGPASPYSNNISNPQIAVTDSLDDLHGLTGAEDIHHHFVKSSFPQATDTFYTNYPNYAPAGNTSIHQNMAAVAHRQKSGRGLLPPPDFQRPRNTSRPVSVASSIVSDSPATPSGEPEDDRRQRTGELFDRIDHFVPDTYSSLFDDAAFNMPKLERTMTDVLNDELYNPSNFNMTSTSQGQIPVSPSNDLFAQRIHAANTQHLSANHSPALGSSRERSPFRHGSPLAPMPNHDFPSAMQSAHLGFGSAQQLREQRKAEHDAQAMQNQLARRSDTGTPQTISPKDAVLDFQSPEGEANFPLFPQQDATGFGVAQPKGFPQQFSDLQLNGTSFGNYVSSQLPTNLQIPQQYPFIAQPPHHQARDTPISNNSSVPSRLSSAESGQPESAHGSASNKPAGASADGGTYTCTYHGCTLRFETPALLQKHKREGHRQAHTIGGQRKADVGGAGMASSLLNSQAGPHRCLRINPSTGKKCNTVFSRPYDLTRHEHTIHNARKKKVRCELCTDDKTFSRGDALTRHYRVCHPNIEFPGKRRRRGGQSV